MSFLDRKHAKNYMTVFLRIPTTTSNNKMSEKKTQFYYEVNSPDLTFWRFHFDSPKEIFSLS